MFFFKFELPTPSGSCMWSKSMANTMSSVCHTILISHRGRCCYKSLSSARKLSNLRQTMVLLLFFFFTWVVKGSKYSNLRIASYLYSINSFLYFFYGGKIFIVVKLVNENIWKPYQKLSGLSKWTILLQNNSIDKTNYFYKVKKPVRSFIYVNNFAQQPESNLPFLVNVFISLKYIYGIRLGLSHRN